MANERELRVLVALDNAEPNERALRLLAELEDPQALELTCLFVEDEDLLRAATLPGLREISPTGQAARLDADRLSRELAEAAAAARRAFDTLAGHLHDLLPARGRLRHRFMVTRGRITEEFDRAAERCDLVMVTRSAGLRVRRGRSFLALARQPKPVLFVNEPWHSGSSVVVLADNERAVDVARRVARAENLRLVAIVSPGGASDAQPSPLPDGAAVRQLGSMDEEGIARVCLAEDARLLVIPARADLDWSELLVSLMDKLPCSLLKLAG